MDIFDTQSENTIGKPHAKRVGRELAMQYLFRCDMRGELPDAATFAPFFEQMKVEHQLLENRTGRKSREYAERLYVCVTLHKEEIDQAIQSAANNWNLDRLSLVERNILRVAVAEMKYFDEVPPVVSIDEGVEIAIDYSGEEAGGFINGVLNGIKNTLKS